MPSEPVQASTDEDTQLQFYLDQIPDQYVAVEGIISIIFNDFPEVIESLSEKRIQGWIDEMNSGNARTPDDIRDDIAKWIIGKDRMMKTYGVSAETAEALIIGGNEGGINFSALKSEDFQLGLGTGDVTGDDEGDDLRLLSGIHKWYKDPKTGLYYASYKLEASGRELVFEASEQDMNAIFGDGIRPSAESVGLRELTARDNVTYSGDVGEVTGDENFREGVDRIIAIALDEGKLPEWAQNDPEAEELLFISISEAKGPDWLIEKLAELPTFQARFPGLEAYKLQNLDTVGAIAAHLEAETKLKQLEIQAGRSGQRITPQIVGDLAEAGYDFQTVALTYGHFQRMADFAPAFAAFNEVLVAAGKDPLAAPSQMFQFLTGNAPDDVYELYEASALREAAVVAGIGDFFAADEVIAAASAAPFAINLQAAYGSLNRAAADILRFRSEIDLGKYDIDADDMIDLALGIAPRSGRSQAEISQNMGRALQEASGFLKERIKPFFGFTSKGRPQAISFGELRSTSV